MPGKSADDKKFSVNKGAKTNFNKRKPAVKKAVAKRATPPKPRAKPARKAAPKPRKKPDSVKARGFKRKTDNAGGPRKAQGSTKTAQKARQAAAKRPRAGMKSKGPAPKSNKSRKGHRLDRVR